MCNILWSPLEKSISVMVPGKKWKQPHSLPVSHRITCLERQSGTVSPFPQQHLQSGTSDRIETRHLEKLDQPCSGQGQPIHPLRPDTACLVQWQKHIYWSTGVRNSLLHVGNQVTFSQISFKKFSICIWRYRFVSWSRTLQGFLLVPEVWVHMYLFLILETLPKISLNYLSVFVFVTSE